MSWAFMLEPVDQTSTRLITRSRGANDRVALGLMLMVIWHPLDFGMPDGSCSASSDWWRHYDGAPRPPGPAWVLIAWYSSGSPRSMSATFASRGMVCP